MIKTLVPVVTLSTEDNTTQLEQLKYVFKRTMNWNKCQSKTLTEGKNQYLYYSIDPNFQGVNKLFFIISKKSTKNNLQTILSSVCRNKQLYCYN